MARQTFVRPAVVLSVILAAQAGSPAARANGRFPTTISVTTQPGDDQLLLVGFTQGALISRNDGQTFGWTCEDSIGYSGTWDPVYAISPAGTMFASTDDGLAISRDGGCSWDFAGGPLEGAWIADVQVGGDGAVWVATSTTAAPNDVYVSRDDGVTFVPSNAPLDQGYWKALRVAPSDPMRVYISGYRLADPNPIGMIRRSDDGGQTWTSLNWPGSSRIFVAGVSATDPDVAMLRRDGSPEDSLFRTEDAGESWSPVLAMNGDIRLAGRTDGTTWIAAIPGQDFGVVRLSTDGGLTWSPTAQQPVMTCIHERASDGDLFACGDNWAPDYFAIGRSTDAQSWTKIYRFIETTQLSCPPESEHAEKCTPLWPGIVAMFDIGSPDAGPPDASMGATNGNGTCGCGVASAVVIFVIPRRRRRTRV